MQGQDFPGLCLLTINTFHGRNDGTTICGAGERLDTSVMLGISINDNLSQKVYTAYCLSILSECTVRFLTVKIGRASCRERV